MVYILVCNETFCRNETMWMTKYKVTHYAKRPEETSSSHSISKSHTNKRTCENATYFSRLEIVNYHASNCKIFIHTQAKSEAAPQINRCVTEKCKHSTCSISLALRSSGLAGISGSGSFGGNEAGRITLSAGLVRNMHLIERLLSRLHDR